MRIDREISRSGYFLLRSPCIATIFPLSNMDSQKLGGFVRHERKVQGLRQDELAAASGVGIRFIVDLEAGKPTLQLAESKDLLAVSVAAVAER